MCRCFFGGGNAAGVAPGYDVHGLWPNARFFGQHVIVEGRVLRNYEPRIFLCVTR